MNIEKFYFFSITIWILIHNWILCSEIVPVFMWGSVNSRFLEHIPALHKITEDSFKDPILEDVKSPYVVIFAEKTLSPEDFAQHDQYGEIPFSNIRNLKKSTKILYKSHVQNPIRAVKQINKPITEISVGNLLSNFTVPIDDILIINLNDAKDDEHRFDMLKRHDSDISFIYNKLLEKYDQVLAIYTAYHSSRIAPEEMVHHKQRRSLLAENTKDSTTDNRKVFRTQNVLMYISDIGTYNHDNKSITINNFDSKSEDKNTSIILTLMGDKLDLKFGFLLSESNYWYLDAVSVMESGKELNITNSTNIYAPKSFSYHCNDTIFSLNNTRTLILPGLQVQPYWNQAVNANTTFGDAYNCVGFTSIPIWSGLFVTMILLFIMTFGLTMMMDIKTMDRFDDAKGKTITINTSE